MKKITQKVEHLRSVLEHELSEHHALIETAHRMNEALKKRDITGVRTLSGRYDDCTCRVERLEEQRLEACDELARALGFGERHLNLPSLIDALPQELRPGLVSVRRKLKEKIAELARVNTGNQVMLEESLVTVAQTMRFLARGSTKAAGYKQGGKRTNGSTNRSFINRTA